MSFLLLPLSTPELRSLAEGIPPAHLAARAETEALPPHFVVTRALHNEGLASSRLGPTSFLIVRAADARIVGSCGFKFPPHDGRVEVGYGVAPEARGSGAATAALGELVRLAFDAGLTEVLAEILPSNKASQRVATKAGFVPVCSRIDEDQELVVQWVRRRDVPLTSRQQSRR